MLRPWSRGNYFRVGGENQINRRYADIFRGTLSLTKHTDISDWTAVFFSFRGIHPDKRGALAEKNGKPRQMKVPLIYYIKINIKIVQRA
jgi:hypothetical protein